MRVVMKLRIPRGVASLIVCSIALFCVYLIGLGVYTEVSALVDDLPAYWLWAKVAPVASWNYVKGELPPGSTHLEAMENVWLADRKR